MPPLNLDFTPSHAASLFPTTDRIRRKQYHLFMLLPNTKYEVAIGVVHIPRVDAHTRMFTARLKKYDFRLSSASLPPG